MMFDYVYMYIIGHHVWYENRMNDKSSIITMHYVASSLVV